MTEEVGQLAEAVSALLDHNPWALSDGELVDDVVAVSGLIDRLAVLRAGLVREIDARALYAADGSSSVAVWLRDRLRLSVRTGRQLAMLSRLLDAHPALRDAVVGGRATVEQAGVIADSLRLLPVDVGDELRDKAEQALLDHADRLEPGLLHRLGQRILDHVAPETADAALAARLAADERRAHLRRHFTLSPGGDGCTRVSGWLDTEAAALVAATIEPLSKPVPGVAGEPDLRTPGQRRADALAEVCRLTLAGGGLPDCGGERPQITITTRLEALTTLLRHADHPVPDQVDAGPSGSAPGRSGPGGAGPGGSGYTSAERAACRFGLGIGVLDTGGLLSAAAVRRLACDAELIPAVLGTDSTVLDLGRSRRLYVGSARRALILRDRGCAFPGCDRPPRWCHAHHMTSWLHGGRTDQNNGVLLCGYHHRLIHHSEWQVRPGSDGRPEFIPPAHIDPHRRPMRNLYHHRT